MNKYVAFNQESVKNLREELTAHLAAFGDEHGISFSIGNIKFTKEMVTTGLSVTINASDGSTVNPEEVSFKRNAYRHGFKAEHLGAKFSDKGKVFKITGWNRGGKYNLRAMEVSTGKRYKFSPVHVLELLGIETVTIR